MAIATGMDDNARDDQRRNAVGRIAPAIAITAVVLVSAVVFARLGIDTSVITLVVVAAIVLVLSTVMMAPKAAVVATVLLLFFGNRNEIPQLMFWGRYVPTVGIALVILSAFMWHLTHAAPLRGGRILTLYGLFTAFVLASAFFNHSTGRDAVLSLATNLRYPLFFVALVNLRLSTRFLRRILWLMVGLTLLQVPVALYQFLVAGKSSDFLVGTMGQNGPLLAVVLASQFMLIAVWLTKRGWLPLLGAAILLVPVLLGDIEAGVVFLPIVIAWVILRHFGWRRLGPAAVRLAGAIILLVACVVAAAVDIPAVRGFMTKALPRYTDADYYTDPATVRDGSLGRLTVFYYAIPLLATDPFRLLWGYGPESAQGGLMTAHFDDVSTTDAVGAGVVCKELNYRGVSCRESQTFRSVMEFGFGGLVVYLIPVLLLWRGTGRQLRRGDRHDVIIAAVFEAQCAFFVLLAPWYISVWRLDAYSLPFWLTAAVAYQRRLQLERRLTEPTRDAVSASVPVFRSGGWNRNGGVVRGVSRRLSRS